MDTGCGVVTIFSFSVCSRPFYEKRISAEVDASFLGAEWEVSDERMTQLAKSTLPLSCIVVSDKYVFSLGNLSDLRA